MGTASNIKEALQALVAPRVIKARRAQPKVIIDEAYMKDILAEDHLLAIKTDTDWND